MEKYNIVIRWNMLLLQAIKTERKAPSPDEKKPLPPPLAARAISMLHTAMYDAWAQYDKVAIPVYIKEIVRQTGSNCTDNNRKEAISHAANCVLCALFQGKTEQNMFQALMKEFGYLDKNNAPARIGIKAAEETIAFRKDDTYTIPSDYQPINTEKELKDINRWQPLILPDGTVQSFLFPDWATCVQPFAIQLKDGTFKPKPPIHYPNTLPFPKEYCATDNEAKDALDFEKQCEEVLQFSASLDDTKKMIAEYWADGSASVTPPGHWCVLARFISKRNYHTIEKDIKLFFALGNALLDSSIAAWWAKRRHDSCRPITAIRALFKDKPVSVWHGAYNGIGEIVAQDWQSYLSPAPPFAEHVSGHSTFSASAANVLRCFTGKDYFGYTVTLPAGSSMREPGLVPATDITLTFNTYSEAAEQAGLSRCYGGIHFLTGNTEGLALGKKVGEAVFKLAEMYWNGDVKKVEDKIENC